MQNGGEEPRAGWDAEARLRLAALWAARLRGRPVAGNGRFTEHVRGRHSAPTGPVEVGVEADQGQVVLLRRDVLVGVIEIEPKTFAHFERAQQVPSI
jgi:hypothetical protein